MQAIKCGFCGAMIVQAVVQGDIRRYAILEKGLFLVRGKVVACCDACAEKIRKGGDHEA